jgi:hypothetical protein
MNAYMNAYAHEATLPTRASGPNAENLALYHRGLRKEIN